MIAIGSDHGGFELKGHIIEHLKEKGIEVKDFGTYSEASVDYPDCAKPVCKAVLDGECECGILICGTGIGISMAANKFKGIKCQRNIITQMLFVWAVVFWAESLQI